MSSGFSYPQPIFTSPIYNPAFYLTLDASGYLTYDYAQILYLSKNDYRLTYLTGITQGIATPGVALVPGTGGNISGIGALSCSSLTVNESSITATPSYVIGISEGVADVSKALVLNSSKNITGINSLSATTLTGTLQTAAQPNITTVGTLSSLSISQSGSASAQIAQFLMSSLAYASSCYLTLGRGTGANMGARIGCYYDNAIANSYLFLGSNSVPTTLVIGNNGNVGVNNSSPAYQLDVGGTVNVQGTLNFSGTTRAITNALTISAGSITTTGDITCGGVINGFLAYGNQANITTVGSLTELGINSTPTNEYFSITGSGLDYLDGSYTRMLTFPGSNLTPVQFQIEVHNGTNATSSNASWIGNITNNDLRFGVNNSTSMILTTTGRLGLGTTSPSAPLHVPNSNSFTFGAGGLTVYRLRTDNGNTESALGPLSYSVAAIFGGYISCTAMAMTSDRRLKRNIQPCPIDRVKRLFDSCEVKLYEWNESENRQGQEIGLIVQDLASAHLTDLISVFYRGDIQEGEDPSLESAKTQLNVDYSRIAAYNMKMIQHLLVEIDRLKDRLANIES